MHKYHNGKLPIMFNECFPNNETIPHHYNIGRINPPRQILSGYSEKMIKYNAMDILNTIPDKIKSLAIVNLLHSC